MPYDFTNFFEKKATFSFLAFLSSFTQVMSVRDDVGVRVSRLNDFRSDRLSSINTACGVPDRCALERKLHGQG